MNPFLSRTATTSSWLMPVSFMCLVLGFMIALAWVTDTNRSSRSSYLPFDQRSRVAAGLIDVEEFERMQEEIKKLQDEKTALENAIGDGRSEVRTLNTSLQDMKIQANQTELEGPGVVVTLKDSPKAQEALVNPGIGGDSIIHDQDVLRVVNELFAAGAEAVAVNSQRVTATTSFHCVGNVIHVNSVPISSPVTIRAIGDAQTLLGALNMPLGVLAEIRNTDPSMAQIEMVKKQKVPAYVGPTKLRHASVPTPETDQP
jgi:uncharacterized protein YlxW (UPF0749 family)